MQNVVSLLYESEREIDVIDCVSNGHGPPLSFEGATNIH
jgi:hypothetical protein